MIRTHWKSGRRRTRTLLPRALALALGLLLAWGQSLHPASHPVNQPATHPANAGASMRQDVGASASAASAHRHGDATNLRANGNACADQHADPHTIGQGAHAGCPCLHASCGGIVALLDTATPAGVTSTAGFMRHSRPGAALPAHQRQLLRPPTRLTA